MQRAAIDAAPVAEVPPIVHEVLRSPGQPLDAATRAFMEPQFGHDFSGVRVHTDARAAESARAVNALAYTIGRDAVFEAGQYAPQTSDGRRLLAHELTHTIQQGRWSGKFSTLAVSSSSDVGEQEADRAASALLRGGAAREKATTSLPPHLARQAAVDGETRAEAIPMAPLAPRISPPDTSKPPPGQRQQAPTPPAHVAKCPPLVTPSGRPATVMKKANDAARVLLGVALFRLIAMKRRVGAGEMGKVPPNHQDWKTLRAAQRQLHVHVGRRQEFLDVVGAAIARVLNALGLKAQLVRERGADPATLCGDPKKCTNTWTLVGGDGVIHHCDLFFWRGPLCQRDLNTHERFHAVGVPNESTTTDPNKTSDFVGSLNDLVLDVNDEAVVFNCDIGK